MTMDPTQRPGAAVTLVQGPRGFSGPQGPPGEPGPPGPAGDPADLTDVIDPGTGRLFEQLIPESVEETLGSVVSRDEYERAAELRQSSAFVRSMAFAGVMEAPPTLAESSGSASSLTGAVLVAYDDTRLRQEGVIGAAENGYLYYRKTNGSGSGASLLPWRVSFGFDGLECEIKLNAPTTGARYRVWVDGRPHSATMVSAAATGNRRVKVTFATRAPRTIMLEFDGGAYFGGVWRLPTDSVSPPTDGSPVRLTVLGDSFVYGTGAVSSRVGGFVSDLGRLLGWPLTTAAGAGGTGYITANAPEGNYLTRFPDVVDSAPDVLLVTGSQNDQSPVSSTPGSLTAAAGSLIALVRDELPNTRLVLSGLLFPATPSAPQLEINAEIKAAAVAHDIPFIETQSPAWFYGTGTTGTPTGNGNADYYRGGSAGTDPAHPTPAGHQQYARLFAAALPAALGLG